MRHLSALRRALAILGLVAGATGLVAATAQAQDAARPCRHPEFVTSTWEGHGLGRYYADSDMWNADGYDVSQTMRVCSHGNWSVDVRADDSAGDGAVQDLPERPPRLPRLGHGSRAAAQLVPVDREHVRIALTAASGSTTAPTTSGSTAWPDHGSTELMIWTDNHRQTPAGKVVERHLAFSHRTWKLWATGDHHYLAFVPDRPLHHGRIALLKRRFAYLAAHGYLPAGSTLGQVCFGYEMVSTNGTTRRFKVDRFSVTSSRK